MTARLSLLCLIASHALAQDAGIPLPVILGPGDFPSHPVNNTSVGLCQHDERATMSVWNEARGAAEEAFGLVEAWLGEMTRSKALKDQGDLHRSRGAGLRGGPATREVARRQAIILKRIANAKVMRATHA